MKYQKDDLVRIVDRKHGHLFAIGEEVTIIGIDAVLTECDEYMYDHYLVGTIT